jgi:UDP-perosamine 4-acetyltransferase
MNDNEQVYVIGAGGHAKVVISTLLAAGDNVQAIFDDDPRKWGESLLGIPVAGATSELGRLTSARAVIAIGDNASRRRLAKRFQRVDWVTVVHPSATVHPSVQLGPGTVVFAGTVIQPATVIGAHGIINTGATVDHDCLIEDYAHIAPGAHLGGGVRLGEGGFLGIGSTVSPGVMVGRWTVVGAGGVVVRDLPDDVVAVGVPANPVK